MAMNADEYYTQQQLLLDQMYVQQAAMQNPYQGLSGLGNSAIGSYLSGANQLNQVSPPKQEPKFDETLLLLEDV